MAKKNGVRPNIQIGGAGLSMADLKNYAENNPNEFAHKAQGLIDDGLRWEDIRDLPGLFRALGDVQVTTQANVLGETRDIQASAFPLLSGGLTVAGINDAYDAVPNVSDQLVQEIRDNKKSTNLANVTSENVQIDSLQEGEPFPEMGSGEERYEIRSNLNGRRITVSSQMVEENNVNGILDKVNGLGEWAGKTKEKLTIRRVCDIDGSATTPAEPYVLHKDGAGAALYQTDASPHTRLSSSGNRYTTNALVDTTDLDNVRLRLASFKGSDGDRISIPASRCTLLVPDALVGTALKIRGSEMEPSVENEKNNWGPSGAWQPKVVSSPYLDDLSTTAWYYGWFEKQFVRKIKLDMEYVTLEGNTQLFLTKRVAFQARIAFDIEVGARDYVYVVQSLSGTTAP